MAQQSGRLLSLDVMRGITIAGMILVNNPGSWKYVYTPLEHARWNGLTPTDLVFPFFMFIMGVSMFFSLRKYNFKLSKESVTKVLRRTVLIFLVGLGLNLFGHVCYNGFTDFQNLRILGVMQRLALAYGFGSLIGLAINHKYILQVAAGILIFYWALLGFTHSMEMSEDSIIAIVDRTLFGTSHMYHDDMADGTRIAFDPEGLLSCIGSIAHVLLGFYVGKGARYHSLIAKKDTVPDELIVTAEDDMGEVMAVRHRDYEIYGLQFHPESILTSHGMEMIKNFINI